MAAVSDLTDLLKSMKPERVPGEYVYCTSPATTAPDAGQVIGYFREKEGFTLILRREDADHRSLPYEGIFAWITLTVHSSLTAAGLTAAFSGALAGSRISCNVIAGFYHDHLFVPYQDAEKAMEVLLRLQRTGA